MNGVWTKVYDLVEDEETTFLVQKASLQTTEFGFVPEVALFGTKEWWNAVQGGRIPRHTVQGVISRLYMSGHGDWPEFEIKSGEQTTRWTRLGNHTAYQAGRMVRLEYVLQRPKKSWRSQEVKQVLRIFIEQD